MLLFFGQEGDFLIVLFLLLKKSVCLQRGLYLNNLFKPFPSILEKKINVCFVTFAWLFLVLKQRFSVINVFYCDDFVHNMCMTDLIY